MACRLSLASLAERAAAGHLFGEQRELSINGTRAVRLDRGLDRSRDFHSYDRLCLFSDSPRTEAGRSFDHCPRAGRRAHTQTRLKRLSESRFRRHEGAALLPSRIGYETIATHIWKGLERGAIPLLSAACCTA